MAREIDKMRINELRCCVCCIKIGGSNCRILKKKRYLRKINLIIRNEREKRT